MDMSEPIYMDYAAATPVDERVMRAMEPYFSSNYFNPSSIYLASRGVKSDLAEARAEVAFWLGARPAEIIFTAGATEANNLALNSLHNIGGQLLYTTIEHEAIIEPANRFDSNTISVDKYGLVDIDDLRKKINSDTGLVSVIYANNEIGTVQHMAQVAEVVLAERDRRKSKDETRPIYLHTDASQAPNFLDLHVDKLGVDLMTLNGGKIYGPKQSGILYVRAGVAIDPLIRGGGQEHGLRSGTENVAFAVGFAKALALAQKQRKEESHRLGELSQKAMKLMEGSIENIEFNGHPKQRIPNIISVIVHGIDGERAVMMLDEAGIQAATGSACSALSDNSSHVVRAIGRSDEEAGSTLRFSFGRTTSQDHIDQLVSVLPGIVKASRELR